MEALPVTALYGGILALVYAYISLYIGLTRAKSMELYGNGKGDHMQKLVRAQGNASEYIPISLLLLALLECNAALATPLLHAFGATLAACRSMHMYQLAHPNSPIIMRQVGFLGTIALMAIGGVLNILAGASKA